MGRPVTPAAIGIDIGGSAIKFAVVDAGGRILWPPDGVPGRVAYSVLHPGVCRLTWGATNETEELIYGTGPPALQAQPASGGRSVLVAADQVVPAAVAQEALRRALRRIVRGFGGKLAAVGIGATGLIDRSGIVTEGYAFSDYPGTDWGAVAADAGFPEHVQVLNDARAGAWAEYVLSPPVAAAACMPGSGPASGAFLHVTVGTRIGCAAVVHGQLLAGADSCAGEFSYQQLLSPGAPSYAPCARLSAGLYDDPAAFGAALTGVLHVVNPQHVLLQGFAPAFVARVQAHVDQHAFAVHRRTIEALDTGETQTPSVFETLGVSSPARPLLAILRATATSILLIDGGPCGKGTDFFSRLLVCAPEPLGAAGGLHFLEGAGSFGIEADYAVHSGVRAPFAAIVAAAAAGDPLADACLARAAALCAVGIANVCTMLAAQSVTVGGAVPLLYPPYLARLAIHLAEHFRPYGGAPAVRSGVTANDAGVIGAALYALNVP
jgi:predicted NBD/HSP70 family sugar kinase